MTVAFVKLADSQIYMADHYTKSTRFHDADNDKVVLSKVLEYAGFVWTQFE